MFDILKRIALDTFGLAKNISFLTTYTVGAVLFVPTVTVLGSIPYVGSPIKNLLVNTFSPKPVELLHQNYPAFFYQAASLMLSYLDFFSFNLKSFEPDV